MRKQILSALVILFSFTAALSHDEQEPVSGLLVEPINPQILQDMSGDFQIVFDPQLIESAQPIDLSIESLKIESQRMTAASYRERQSSEVIIPASTEDAAVLESLSDLSREDLSRFLSRKDVILRKVAESLLKVRLSAKKVNLVVTKLNAKLFENARHVSRANASLVIELAPQATAGISLGKHLIGFIKKLSPTLNSVPTDLGFHLTLSSGASFISTFVDGKRKIRIEPFAEAWWGQKFPTPYVALSAGFIASVYTQKEFPSFQRSTFFQNPIFSEVKDENKFGLSSGISLSPLGPLGATINVKGNVFRMSLLPTTIQFVYQQTPGAAKYLAEQTQLFFTKGMLALRENIQAQLRAAAMWGVLQKTPEANLSEQNEVQESHFRRSQPIPVCSSLFL